MGHSLPGTRRAGLSLPGLHRATLASVRALLLVTSLVLGFHAWNGPSHARAQGSAADHATPTEALDLFRSARERYREGRYTEAASDLERAIVLDPSSATLHYNLARVYELMGRMEEALARYRHYLGMLPETEREERERTEQTIQRLLGAIASGVEQQPEQAEPTEFRELQGTVIVRERGVADAAFFATLGAGAALLVAGAITGGLALDRAGQRDGLVLTDPSMLMAHTDRYASLDSEAGTLGIATDVLLVGGGATLVAGLLLFVLRENEVEREITPEAGAALRPVVRVSSNGALVGIGGRL
jgi:tetratricopeptide (TPR) repeat protein